MAIVGMTRKMTSAAMTTRRTAGPSDTSSERGLLVNSDEFACRRSGPAACLRPLRGADWTTPVPSLSCSWGIARTRGCGRIGRHPAVLRTGRRGGDPTPGRCPPSRLRKSGPGDLVVGETIAEHEDSRRGERSPSGPDTSQMPLESRFQTKGHLWDTPAAAQRGQGVRLYRGRWACRSRSGGTRAPVLEFEASGSTLWSHVGSRIPAP
jgi:hypothetical protein